MFFFLLSRHHARTSHRTVPTEPSMSFACTKKLVYISLFAGKEGGGGWSLINYSPGPKKGKESQLRTGHKLRISPKGF